MTRHLTAALMLWCSLAASASDIYSPALDEIIRNSLTLRQYEAECRAAVAENATSLTPSNPEVELGYLWGEPGAGHRKDVSVTQEFDFPTAYGRRRNVARGKDAAARSQLRERRSELLLGAKCLLVELVHANAMCRLHDEMAAQARRVAEAYSRMLEAGNATQLDRNKAALNLAEAENELLLTRDARDRLLSDLAAFNGGIPLIFSASEYPEANLPADFALWYDSVAPLAPSLQLLRDGLEVEQRNEALVRAEGLPKLSAGYTGEFVRGDNFQGFTVGFSIPLWENRHKVRAAKARAAGASATLEDASATHRSTMLALYGRAMRLKQVEERYRSALDGDYDLPLLTKALDKGQLTMLEYISETRYALEMRAKLLEAQRDRELALAQLYSHAL